MNIPDLIPGDRIQVLVADLPLWLAKRYTLDVGAWWDQTMPRLMQAYHLSIDDYWDLTVADHAALAAAIGLQPAEVSDDSRP